MDVCFSCQCVCVCARAFVYVLTCCLGIVCSGCLGLIGFRGCFLVLKQRKLHTVNHPRASAKQAAGVQFRV